MNNENDLWRLEGEFWRGGADYYEETLAPGALMVLPQPVGIIDRTTTIESIRSGGARWRNVTFSEQHHMLINEDTAVLAYAVQADRGNSDTAYVARCSSTYVRVRDRWHLVLHHQS